MRELDHLLHELDPPPGGLQRLQQAVDAYDSSARRRPHRAMIVALSCGAMVVMLVAWRLPALLATRQYTAMLLDAMQQAVPPDHDGIRVKNGSALELPSGQPNARVYLVETTAP
jgi:ferric-dicitrate binding protein FerR (iron transport regulator)